MLGCRALMLLWGGVFLMTIFARWDDGAEAALAGMAFSCALTLYFQTRAALLLLGRAEAYRYLFAALFLVPLFLTGPILVPSLVAIELRKRVRE
jgi:hypothetical protein